MMRRTDQLRAPRKRPPQGLTQREAASVSLEDLPSLGWVTFRPPLTSTVQAALVSTRRPAAPDELAAQAAPRVTPVDTHRPQRSRLSQRARTRQTQMTPTGIAPRRLAFSTWVSRV